MAFGSWPAPPPSAEVLDGIRLLSLDVFDTLLFRLVSEPGGLFEVMGREALLRGLVKTPVGPELFRLLRVEAARRAYEEARLQGRTDPTLEQIYGHFAAITQAPLELLALEMETEEQAVRANPVFPPLLREARRRGIPMFLVSDMYLGADRILRLLALAGYPASWFEAVLVSVDQGCSKEDGGLFRCLLGRRPDLRPDQVLHIGDNPDSDDRVPAALGLRTFLYQGTRGPATAREVYEQVWGGVGLAGMAPVRRLALASPTPPASEDLSAEASAAWYRHGVEAMGPFVAAFADWVVTGCREEGVDLVCPLTRDAHVLAPAIERAAAVRGLALKVRPLHASRQSVFLAGFERLDRATVAALCRSPFEPAALLRRFGLELPEELLPVAHTPLSLAAGTLATVGGTTQDWLEALLLGDPVRLRVDALLKEERALLADFIKGEWEGYRRVAVVDYSYQNTIGSALAALARTLPDGPETYSFITFGEAGRISGQLLDGIRVRSFLGGPGCPLQALRSIRERSVLLEEMLYGGEGTTMGYQRLRDGRVAAVLAPCLYSPAELAARRTCQEGMAAFQDLWCRLSVDLGTMAQPPATAILQHLARIICLPTREEAALLGELQVELSLGGSRRTSVCSTEALPELLRAGSFAFLAQLKPFGQPGSTYWPEGMVETHFPGDLALRHLHRQGAPAAGFLALALVVAARGLRRIAVHGAGARGREAIQALRGVGLEVVALADRNPRLQGQLVEGLRVLPPHGSAAEHPDAVVIGSEAYIEAIRRDLATIYHPDQAIFSLDQFVS